MARRSLISYICTATEFVLSEYLPCSRRAGSSQEGSGDGYRAAACRQVLGSLRTRGPSPGSGAVQPLSSSASARPAADAGGGVLRPLRRADRLRRRLAGTRRILQRRVLAGE